MPQTSWLSSACAGSQILVWLNRSCLLAVQAELRKRQQLLGGDAGADAEAEAQAAAAEAAAAEAAAAEVAAAAEAGAEGGPREEL